MMFEEIFKHPVYYEHVPETTRLALNDNPIDMDYEQTGSYCCTLSFLLIAISSTVRKREASTKEKEKNGKEKKKGENDSFPRSPFVPSIGSLRFLKYRILYSKRGLRRNKRFLRSTLKFLRGDVVAGSDILGEQTNNS